MTETNTAPVTSKLDKGPAANVIAHQHTDEYTGMRFVHKDLVQVLDAHHIAPPLENLQLADAASWADFVTRYASPETLLMLWDRERVQATLDYHTAEQVPGRANWLVTYAYPFTRIYRDWQMHIESARETRLTHEQFTVLMERSIGYIEESDTADAAMFMDVVSTLRVTSNSQAESTYQPDGSTALSFSRDTNIRGSRDGQTQLPGKFTLVMPLFDADEDLPLRFTVRLRPILDANDKINLSISSDDFQPNRDRLLKEHVDAIHSSLGDFASIPMLHEAS